MTISSFTGIKPPVVKKFAKMSASLARPADPTLIYGVELEIEGLGNFGDLTDLCVAGVTYHADGSLRNNGAEYVTAPMRYHELEHTLTNFFNKNKLTEKNYSERCSVHVHTNVSDMTWEQFQTLVLIYQVFEKCLFGFIGNERERNIFCVPLYDTILTRKVLSSPTALINGSKAWEKYTALNFLPVWTQGSIEFRHMTGTCNMAYILTWCQIIGKMFAFAKKHTYEEIKTFFLTLNTTSLYADGVYRVFEEYAIYLTQVADFHQRVEDGVLAAKYAIGCLPARKKTLYEQDLSQYWRYETFLDAVPVGYELVFVPIADYNTGHYPGAGARATDFAYSMDGAGQPLARKGVWFHVPKPDPGPDAVFYRPRNRNIAQEFADLVVHQANRQGNGQQLVNPVIQDDIGQENV
jgi:hypothetical protein